MEIHQVSVGEWMNTLQSLMSHAADGDCFRLPTDMHLHAFFLVKEAAFPDRDFKVELSQTTEV
jgi:hypothetical protein